MTSCIKLMDFIKKSCEERIINNRIEINNNVIEFLPQENKFKINSQLLGNDHNRIFDLSKLENHSVVMLLLELFSKGYSSNNIYLEKG
ncbi:MAG: hypothetical protein LBM25_02555 [Bacteroidales bacterium]|jgi:hypothetical protein|nr:hypothetical protein [Bacteroidales bacterium]